jgi:hypothetical protein
MLDQLLAVGDAALALQPKAACRLGGRKLWPRRIVPGWILTLGARSRLITGAIAMAARRLTDTGMIASPLGQR